MNAARWSATEDFKFIWTELKNKERIFRQVIIKLIERRNHYGETILHLCVRSNDAEKLLFLWTEIEDFFQNSSRNFRDLVLKRDLYERKSIMDRSLDSDNVNFHETLWNLLSPTFEEHRNELWTFLLSPHNILGETFMHDLVRYKNQNVVGFTFEKIKEIFGTNALVNALKTCNWNSMYIDNSNPSYPPLSANFEFMINKLEELTSNDGVKTVLKHLNMHNRNLLQSSALFNNCIEFHECLWNCYRVYFTPAERLNFITHHCKDNDNLLHFVVLRNTREVVDFTWNQIKTNMDHVGQVEYLNVKGIKNFNLLQHAKMNRQHTDVKDWMLNILREYGIEF